MIDESSPSTASHALCEATSLYALIEEQAARGPDALALLAPDRSPLTYAGMLSQLQRTIRALNGFGLGRNDCVALSLPNGPEMAVCSLAAATIASTCSPRWDSYVPQQRDVSKRLNEMKNLASVEIRPFASFDDLLEQVATRLERHMQVAGLGRADARELA